MTGGGGVGGGAGASQPAASPSGPGRPVERRIQVGRIRVGRAARYFQAGQVSGDTRQVWFVCHGYRQLASRFVHPFAGLVELGAVVVAPEALSRFYIDPAPGRHGPEDRVGASWMTRVDREAEIEDYVRYLDALAARVLGAGSWGKGAGPRAKRAGPRTKTVALGFSQGVHTAARWAALGSTPIDELVLWGAYLPADLAVGEGLRRPRLTLVFGDEDPTADPGLAAEQDERLAVAGIEPRRVVAPGGHRVDRGVIRSLAEAFGE